MQSELRLVGSGLQNYPLMQDLTLKLPSFLVEINHMSQVQSSNMSSEIENMVLCHEMLKPQNLIQG